MQAEEIRKRKESEKMVRRGDDEPDWQNVCEKILILNTLIVSLVNLECSSRTFKKILLFLTLQELGAWKTRRRKQSEDAFQRVAEVKALEDCETGEPRKL